jgi:hypothetical protein
VQKLFAKWLVKLTPAQGTCSSAKNFRHKIGQLKIGAEIHKTSQNKFVILKEVFETDILKG